MQRDQSPLTLGIDMITELSRLDKRIVYRCEASDAFLFSAGNAHLAQRYAHL